MQVTFRWRDGRTETITTDGSIPLLDAAEAENIALPYGCRTGACASCVGHLTEGEVSHTRPPRALKPRHRSNGYILTCVGQPETDCTIEVGSAVQKDLVSNPWK